MIALLGGETPSAHNACLRKIPEWIAVIWKFSVNKRATEKKLKAKKDQNFAYFGFHSFHLKKLKIIQ